MEICIIQIGQKLCFIWNKSQFGFLRLQNYLNVWESVALSLKIIFHRSLKLEKS